MSQAKEILSELGGWPLMNNGTLNELNSPLDLLKKMHHFGFSQFVDVGIIRNPNNITNYVIDVYK